MFVYSKKIFQFTLEIKAVIKDVLTEEISLKVHGERFYDRNGRNSYPIKVVIYNQTKTLGYFDPYFYELGFNEQLMHVSKTTLHNTIKHELAHYITFINHGPNADAHGNEFHALCTKLNWGNQISAATACLESEEGHPLSEETGIFRKVQKLMALTNSSNKHEAESAMIKSRELLLKHNMDATYIEESDEEKIVVKRILQSKRINAKMSAIGNILATFFVSALYNKSSEFTYLEILGTATNVEIASYVARILEIELEKLWLQTNLSGITQKNSFFLGVSYGYCDKIGALKKAYSKETSQALMIIENQLLDAQDIIYNNIRKTRSQSKYCAESAALGERIGKNLRIRPGIRDSSNGSVKLIE